MTCILQLLSPLLLALSANSLSILLPIYVYPDTSASALKPVFNAITAHPKVKWLVIVNPGSGSGTNASSPNDANYISGISQLNSFPNVYTLGYVDTASTHRSLAAVNNDVDVCTSWSAYAPVNIAISGIFFDDVNNSALVSVNMYMRSASSYVHKMLPLVATNVVFNPGALATRQLFRYCDLMVDSENSVSKYRNVATIQSIPSDYRSNSAILGHGFPIDINVARLMHTMKYNNAGGV